MNHIPNNNVEKQLAPSEIILKPYVEAGGRYNMPDSHLSEAYRRTVIEKTIHKVFYDGSVQNTKDFITYFKQDHIELIFVECLKKQAGFFWLTPFMQKSAFITYCLYKNFLKESLTISQRCINTIFNRKDEHGEPIYEILLGITPSNNKLALNFLRKNGMEIVGRIPGLINNHTQGKNIDGIVSYLSNYREKNEVVQKPVQPPTGYYHKSPRVF